MKQDDIPKVDSINITPPDTDELDWEANLMYQINKSPDGSVLLPANQYDELTRCLKYTVTSFIHAN